MPEWSNGPDSKSGVRFLSYRGFESHSFRNKNSSRNQIHLSFCCCFYCKDARGSEGMRKANSTHSRQSKMNQQPFEFLLLFLLHGRSRQRGDGRSQSHYFLSKKLSLLEKRDEEQATMPATEGVRTSAQIRRCSVHSRRACISSSRQRNLRARTTPRKVPC